MKRATICTVRPSSVFALRAFVVVLASAGCGGSRESSGGSIDGAVDGSVPPFSDDTSTPPDAGVPTGDDAALESDGSLIDGGASDAGRGLDGGDLAPGAPITAPAATWTWVPFPNAFCANGSATGIGINMSTTSSDVVIYLEGGGACWSETTCYTTKSAVNITSGYGEASFDVESASTSYLAESGGFFDRAATANPFKDASYVYVPYCTGDLHAGSNVAQYGSRATMHVGYKNFTAFLQRIVPTFPSTRHVIITGSSAGGYGAVFNFGQTQRAFSAARVDVIDDSGTFLPLDIESKGIGLEPLWRTEWNLAAALPSGCTACATALAALSGYYAASFPNDRFSLLSYSQDSVIPGYYGITTAQFTSALDEDIGTYFAPNSNAKTFVSAGSGHVLFFNPLLAVGSTNVQQFVTLLATGDSSWASVP
jgi:hypothetical protein